MNTKLIIDKLKDIEKAIEAKTITYVAIERKCPECGAPWKFSPAMQSRLISRFQIGQPIGVKCGYCKTEFFMTIKVSNEGTQYQKYFDLFKRIDGLLIDTVPIMEMQIES